MNDPKPYPLVTCRRCGATFPADDLIESLDDPSGYNPPKEDVCPVCWVENPVRVGRGNARHNERQRPQDAR